MLDGAKKRVYNWGCVKVSCGFLPPPLQTMSVLLIIFSVIVAQIDSSGHNDLETSKIRASFTIGPDTDDIKELRAFVLHSQNDWWPQMMNRFQNDGSDIAPFMREKHMASLEAAEKIMAVVMEQGRIEDANAESEEARKNLNNLTVTQQDNDTVFALKTLIASYHFWVAENSTPELFDKFEKFIESLELNPQQKDYGTLARCLWFAVNSNFACTLSDEQQRLSHFIRTFDDMKKYIVANADNPQLKYHISALFSSLESSAKLIESMPKASVKKGTLVIPILDFFNACSRTWDADTETHNLIRKNWQEYYEREMEKYRILSADEPLQAFREAIKDLKSSLEKELSENSLQRINDFEAISEEMDSRSVAAQLLYQEIRHVFVDTSDPAIKEYASVIDSKLNLLTLEGKEFEFEALLLDGTKIDVKDYRRKVVLLYYWYADSPVLLRDFSFLMGLSHNTFLKDIVIITFCVDRDVNQTKKLVNDWKIPCLNASEILSQEVNLQNSRNKYNINSLPTFVLIDRDGKVVRAITTRNISRGMIRAEETVLSHEMRKLLEIPHEF